jgi:hypothetical protein
MEDPNTKWIAVYGAIVATASIAVSLYVAFRDRAYIKISLTRGMKIKGPDSSSYDPNKTYANISVANRGRRPVTITHVSFQLDGVNHLLLTDSFTQSARELTEGKSTSYLVQEDGIEWPRVRRIVISDATGRTYRKCVPRKQRATS